MTVAMSKAVERGARRSSAPRREHVGLARGLRGACRPQGLRPDPEGKIALGKLSQAMFTEPGAPDPRQLRRGAHPGAQDLRDASHRAGQLAQPDRIEGQKTAAFEVCDQLGEPPATSSSRWETRATSRLLARVPRVPSGRQDRAAAAD